MPDQMPPRKPFPNMVLKGKVRLAPRNLSLVRGAAIPRPVPTRALPPDRDAASLSSLCEAMRVTTSTQQVEAIVALFDLAGFTFFCSQADPPANVPVFLNGFLEWLFKKVDAESAASEGMTSGPLWKEPPFFAKFMGDGILLLWNAGNMVDEQIGRLVKVLQTVGNNYNEYYRKVSPNIKEAPQSLRCRVTRGTVFPVNNGRDYVGHCINVAARLHEYKLFSFAILSQGFSCELSPEFAAQLHALSLPIRGIRRNEIVWVLKGEAASLSAVSLSQYTKGNTQSQVR